MANHAQIQPLGRTRAHGWSACRALAASLVVACGAGSARNPQAPVRPTSLHLAPISGLAKAPGLQWLACATPRTFMLAPALAVAQEQLVPEAKFAQLRQRAGGVDFRALDEFCVAQYTDSQLLLGRGVLDPARAEQAFQADVDLTEARAVDRSSDDGADTIVRLMGRKRRESVQLALFGRSGFALQYGPERVALRAAIAYAEAKLSRSKPALHIAPLESLAALVGAGDLVVYAPGPFSSEVAGVGGLLRGATAAAVRMRVVELTPQAGASLQRPGLAFSIFLEGAYERDEAAALALLAASFDRFTASDLGHLIGLDHAVLAPRTRTEGHVLVLDVTFDAERLAHGLHLATGAQIEEILQVSTQKKD